MSGGALPDIAGISPEAERQLRLRLRNSCLLARSFLEFGFTAVVDDIVSGRRLDHVIEDLDGVGFGFVMLLPDFDHVKARWRSMGSPFVDAWDWVDGPGLRICASLIMRLRPPALQHPSD